MAPGPGSMRYSMVPSSRPCVVRRSMDIFPCAVPWTAL